MTDRQTIEAVIRRTLAARAANDAETLARAFAPNAEYRIAADEDRLPAVRALTQVPIGEGLREMCRTFPAEAFDPVFIVIDGNRAMVISKGRFRFAPTGETFSMELANAWTFDDEARVTQVVDFVDTALLSSIIARAP